MMVLPRKKQRTDGNPEADATSVVVVARPMARAPTEATVGQPRAAVGEEALPVVETRRLKRAARRGRLQALPDLPLDIQFEASPRGAGTQDGY